MSLNLYYVSRIIQRGSTRQSDLQPTFNPDNYHEKRLLFNFSTIACLMDR